MRFLVWMFALACAGLAGVAVERASADDRDTHGRDAEPDYGRVFTPDAVNRIDIRMAPADWQVVVADMQSMAGNSGFGLNVGFSSSQIAACGGRLQADACTASDPPVQGRCAQTGFPAGQLACVPITGGPNNGADETEVLPRTPVYVPADVTFDGETFRRVGFRLKGNSTLYFTWKRGSDKLPFRLNFDGLEARYPETRDRTFFGFPNLAFTNGNLDTSYLRGRVVTDLMLEAGVPRRGPPSCACISIAAADRRTWASTRCWRYRMARCCAGCSARTTAISTSRTARRDDGPPSIGNRCRSGPTNRTRTGPTSRTQSRRCTRRRSIASSGGGSSKHASTFRCFCGGWRSTPSSATSTRTAACRATTTTSMAVRAIATASSGSPGTTTSPCRQVVSAHRHQERRSICSTIASAAPGRSFGS